MITERMRNKYLKLFGFIIILLVVVFLTTASAMARGPAPLFDRPVKLDDSGRPLYNSWERYEEERKKRHQRQNEAPLPGHETQPVVQPHGHPAHEAPVPSSIIINRPVHENINHYLNP